MKIAISVFRNDLRILDNSIVSVPNQRKDLTHWIPVFCLDPKQVDIEFIRGRRRNPLEPRTFVGPFVKTDEQRTRFLVQSVMDLKNRLKDRGSDLLIAVGSPEEVVPRLVGKLNSSVEIYAQQEISSEELIFETLMRRLYGNLFHCVWGSTMFHRDDLPFAVRDLPDTFTTFRKYCETQSQVRELLNTKDNLLPYLEIKDLGVDCEVFARFENVKSFMFGGETKALERLKYYLWDTDNIKKYKDTRNEPMGMDGSTKFSPFLAHGCISARYLYHEIKKYESERGSTDGTYWVIFELLWRDFFKFVALKYGSSMFMLDGLSGNPKRRQWKRDAGILKRWIDGRTGVPWVDAAMRELKQTGFMSNRLRQNVASFFVHSLHMDWRLGATWFESQLIDHDVHSNYGNWLYVAGLGNDPRDNRKFNMIKQARDYDPQGAFVKLWVDELKSLPDGDDKLFAPWVHGGIEGYIAPIIIEPEWQKFSASKKASMPRKSDWRVKRNHNR